jgi:hypothetical protein
MMLFSPLRLLSAFLSLAVIGVLITTIVLFVVALSGDPGSCEDASRPITAQPQHADAFQQKWDQLNATLAAGQVSSTTFSENEVTARARRWVDENDVPVTELYICFTADGGAASGKVDVPFFPGDVDVLVRGTLDLRGEQPEVVIDEIEMGGLPGPVADFLKGRIDSLIEDQTEDLELTHDYGVTFAPGEITISGQP